MAGARDTDIDTVRTQLTAARWYLDRTISAVDTQAARHDIRSARQAYDTAVQLLTQVRLSSEDQQQLEQEMAALRARLQAAGEAG